MSLLEPYPSSGMLSAQASIRVNAVRNDDPDLLAPDAIGRMTALPGSRPNAVNWGTSRRK